MHDFSYHNPTRIEFGRSKEKNIGAYIKEAGYTSVLLVYGMGSIKQSGLYDVIVASLQEAGVSYKELDGVVSNPLLSRVYDGIDLVRNNGLEAVLAVGGGSVVDSAKAIAAGSVYDGDVWDFFVQKAAISQALPVFTVMTLAAAASEMNGNSVVMKDETKQKYSIQSAHIYPKLSVINPELMASVPKEYLAYSAVDAIAHCIEVYFTASTHPNFNARIVESIIKSIMETTEILIKEPHNYEARGEFAWVTIQALNGLTPAGTDGGNFPNHMIEHALSALFNVAHGAGLAVVIPAWMKWYKEQNLPMFQRFAQEVFGLQGADEGIAALESWFKAIGTPVTLQQAGIPQSAIEDLAENAHELGKLWGLSQTYTADVISQILQKA